MLMLYRLHFAMVLCSIIILRDNTFYELIKYNCKLPALKSVNCISTIAILLKQKYRAVIQRTGTSYIDLANDFIASNIDQHVS